MARYTAPTDNPHADAERWENDQEEAAEREEAAWLDRYNYFKEILSCPADQWGKEVQIGKSRYSPEEMLCEVIWQWGIEETLKIFRDLLASPAAESLRQAMACDLAEALDHIEV